MRKIDGKWKDVTGKGDLPVIPPLPPGANPIDPNPEIAICGECGLRLKRVMHYHCLNPRCPCGLGNRTVC